MQAWEVIVLVSSLINTIVVIVLMVLICVLIGLLIKLTKHVDQSVQKVQQFMEKPSEFISFGIVVKKIASFFTAKTRDKGVKK
jgi:uncharacterized membrane protein YqgA involved in biofilm formation